MDWHPKRCSRNRRRPGNKRGRRDRGSLLDGMVKDVGYFLDGMELGITYLGERGWHGVGKSVSKSASGADGGVGRGYLVTGQSWGKNQHF